MSTQVPRLPQQPWPIRPVPVAACAGTTAFLCERQHCRRTCALAASSLSSWHVASAWPATFSHESTAGHNPRGRAQDHGPPWLREFCWKPMECSRTCLSAPTPTAPAQLAHDLLLPTERGGKIYYDGMGQDLADIRGEQP